MFSLQRPGCPPFNLINHEPLSDQPRQVGGDDDDDGDGDGDDDGDDDGGYDVFQHSFMFLNVSALVGTGPSVSMIQ